MAATPTKAQLQDQNVQLNADYDTLANYTAEFEGVELNQRMWVCKRLDAESLYTAGTTEAGRPSLNFTAKRSKKDGRTGKFVSGAWKNMVAYGDLATKAQQLIDSGDKHLDFKAFESTSKGADGRSYSEWVLLDVSGTRSA